MRMNHICSKTLRYAPKTPLHLAIDQRGSHDPKCISRQIEIPNLINVEIQFCVRFNINLRAPSSLRSRRRNRLQHSNRDIASAVAQRLRLVQNKVPSEPGRVRWKYICQDQYAHVNDLATLSITD